MDSVHHVSIADCIIYTVSPPRAVTFTSGQRDLKDVGVMAFSHTDYVFSHTMKNQTDANQPAVFTVDLADLIQLAGHSSRSIR